MVNELDLASPPEDIFETFAIWGISWLAFLMGKYKLSFFMQAS
jgi:hypothetical protein